MRLDKYTPQAANEIRKWIEESLGERLAPGDLLEALKDGVALCQLVNQVGQPGVKYKKSAMPFVQMENISHFLRACEMPPLSMPSHDRFLTVDLYESKDPAQVIQCIAAFSRRANVVNSRAFPRAIGAKSTGGVLSPQDSGSRQGFFKPPAPLPSRPHGASNTSDNAQTFNSVNRASYSGRISPTRSGTPQSPGAVSSWSKRDDESKTAPAWNIHQYGYMGGASQGSEGVSFGARRQITSAGPNVPSLAEKEKRRKEELAIAEKQKKELEFAERQRMEQEERQAQIEEERRWEEETRRRRDKERREAEEERQRWDEEQRQWKLDEEARQKEEKELEARMAAARRGQRTASDARLNGQFLSQYQADQVRSTAASAQPSAVSPSDSTRIKELERQLEEAKERERQYGLGRAAKRESQVVSPSDPTPQQLLRQAPQISHKDDWQASERDYLKSQWQAQQDATPEEVPPPQPPRPLPTPGDRGPPPPPRPTPAGPTEAVVDTPPPQPARPLPTPAVYTPNTNRTDRFLSSNPAPVQAAAAAHRPQDYSTTTEIDLENQGRKESQAKTKAGGWASKSLLEREMERERERQKEWEEGQKETETRMPDKNEGSGPGQTWSTAQYGYMGGDSQNRGGVGLGGRRQIIGPRPPR